MNKETKIKNHGGTRSGNERRKNKKTKCSVEKRSKNDRRSGFDRRKGPGSKRVLKDGIPIERRDLFREDV
jgi:hypothetical protein